MAQKRKANEAPATEEHAPPPHLQPGSQVEISINDKGFRGSWYTGTVIRRAAQSSRNNPLAANNYLVEYHEILNKGATKPLRETVHAANLRPLAPRETSRKFKFAEDVDAYNDDGWWEGTITKELDNGNFHVYFMGSKEQMEFSEDQLRLHREWVNGSWIPPLEEGDEQVKKRVPAEEEEHVEANLQESTPLAVLKYQKVDHAGSSQGPSKSK
ncbi:hypothetical protein CCACVL1_14067 [Corchorus capsularis]|uniref:Agenet domain-containing protein n=1 Tax=Corchorus capsularis TaxID=210143 RepID=A0A1R3I8B7_COCAP|nr:hypothetical protein CCACVL1_14067 [Corchorus capsularis]